MIVQNEKRKKKQTTNNKKQKSGYISFEDDVNQWDQKHLNEKTSFVQFVTCRQDFVLIH